MIIAVTGRLSITYRSKLRYPYYGAVNGGGSIQFLPQGENKRTVTMVYSTRSRVANGIAAATPLVLIILCIVLMVGML